MDDALVELDKKLPPRRRAPEGRRQNLTIEQRFAICQQARLDPKLTQQQLAQWAREHFQMAHEPSQTSISYALTRGKTFKTLEEAQRKLRKRRSVRQPKLDEELLKWVIDCDAKDQRISGELVKQKAHAFCEKLKIPVAGRPTFSNGWLASFNKRHNLKKFKRDPNYAPSDSDDEYLWRKARKAKLKQQQQQHKQQQQTSSSTSSHGEDSSAQAIAAPPSVLPAGTVPPAGLAPPPAATTTTTTIAPLPWNELTEDELDARKRESDLRIEGLRYDNTLKRLKVMEENMLARKRLKDAGIAQEEIDTLVPIAACIAGSDDATLL